LPGQFEWGLGFDWQILQPVINRDRSTIERRVATLYDGAGDDPIDLGWINTLLVLAINFNCRIPHDNV
jgi:hypothetical protein